MSELKKTASETFSEYYEGIAASGKRVVCILDTNSVRYMVISTKGKIISRREYDNNQTSICFANATKALNK